MDVESDKSPPPWSSRLLAGACYLGLGPILSLVGQWRRDVYIRHHRQQALITVLVLCLVAVGLLTYFAIAVYLVRHYSNPYMPGLATVCLPGLGLWGLLSVVGIVKSMVGSTRSIPLVGRLGRRRSLATLAWFGNCVLAGLFVLVFGLGIHASSLARENAASAPVYYLYDDHDYDFFGPCGPALHKLFFYRVSRVAHERWGPGNVVVQPLTAENFRTAIAQGRFVVLTGHGASGAFTTKDGWTVWPDTPAMFEEDRQLFPVIGFVKPNFPTTSATPGKDLQFVYMSACDAGEKATEWEQRLAPARVVTFGRLSAAGEHLSWLWCDAPGQLKEIR
jgi:uncharacterized membrane protein